MEKMIIDNVDFINAPAEKYWSFPKSYKGDSKKDTKNFIMSGTYIGAEKMDGHYARFIKDMDGNMRLQGRSESVNGGYLNKIEWVPQCMDFFNNLPNGTCLLGELYFPNNRGSRKVTTILGCLKDKALDRQEKGEKLNYYIFDVWAYDGVSYLKTPIEDRVRTLCTIEDFAEEPSNIDFAQYYQGEKLWDKYGEVLSKGGEGIVITKLGTVPEPGKRTARKTLKCKMEIEQTIDVFLTGVYKEPVKEYKGITPLEIYSYWENTETGEKFNICKYKEYSNGEPYIPVSRHYALDFAGSVQIAVMKDGKECPVGYISSITDDMRLGIVKNPEQYKGQVFELSCMEIEKTGLSETGYSFRHPKFICARPDKSYLDCEFSQIDRE